MVPSTDTLDQAVALDKKPIARTDTSPKSIPRIVWILWLQGFEHAPPLVHICVDSWLRNNPDWSVRLITKDDLDGLLGSEFYKKLFSNKLPPQKIANIVRIELIARHGGVWVDADCFCAIPLDKWIDAKTSTGFFAFRFGSDRWLLDKSVTGWQRVVSQDSDRILANWFFAGQRENYIFSTFSHKHLELLLYASKKRYTPLAILKKPLTKFLKRNPYLSSKMGNSNFIRWFGFYPYYVFHYHFAATLLEDARFRTIWEESDYLTALPALTYSKHLGFEVDKAFKDDMLGSGSPVYKFHSRRTKSRHEGNQSRFEWLQETFF